MYKLNKRQEEIVSITRVDDSTSIPLDPANTDYQAYLAWLEAGNTPEPADQPEQQ